MQNYKLYCIIFNRLIIRIIHEACTMHIKFIKETYIPFLFVIYIDLLWLEYIDLDVFFFSKKQKL